MGRKALGPEIDVQTRDQAQLDALDQAAAEDGITRAELIRRFLDYGLAMRARARAEGRDLELPA